MDKTGCIRSKNSLFVWEINNFSQIHKKVGEFIESPFFTAGEISSNTIKWQLVLYPFGQKADCKDFLSIFLVCTFCGDVNECNTSCRFFLWDDEPGSEFSFTEKLTPMKSRCGFYKFIRRTAREVQNHLSSSKNDTLSIACSIYNLQIYFANKMNQIELVEGFDLLFLSDRFSDLTIQVDDRELKAHKNILAIRSEVFSAMFKYNTVENNTSVIKITDISYDVMKEILRFIYCGKVENLQNHKEDLLVAANKYNLILLKRICEQTIWNSVNVDNACEILNISDLHNCDGLKTRTITFLIGNLKEIVNSPGFNQLVESNPKLLTEILNQLSDLNPKLLAEIIRKAVQ